MSSDHEVGSGRPPKRTRWKKGQSGNRGRRKARRDATTAEIIDKLFLLPIDIIMQGKTKRVSSRKTRIPPSDDSRPPSNLTTTFLPATGDRPDSGGIGSFMAGVAFLNGLVTKD
jgi:hypothetical protein